MRKFAYAAWAALLCAELAGAQPATRKEPAQYVANERASRVEVRPPGIRLALRKPREFALAPLSGSELAALAKSGPRLKTGVHRGLPQDILATGVWEVTSEGQRLWRLAIQSPGAAGIRVEFRNFSVGSGRVWLYDGTQFQGPYTGRGMFGDGTFWSGTVLSESATLEYEPAAGVTGESAPPFEILTIAHRASDAQLKLAKMTTMVPTATPVDTADYCHLDPNCYAEWKPTMSMVAELRFEEPDGEFACSGTLISTRDNSQKPYLLTAGHCLNTEAAARTLESYWTYQTSSCSGAAPLLTNSSKSTVGAHLLDWATLPDGDFSLLLLQDIPNGVTFAGWDMADPVMGGLVTGIHHPMASWKRISFGERVADMTVDVGGDLAPADKYLSVLWDKGRVEPGSSGSALFSSPGIITGTLTYGPVSDVLSACEINPFVVGYARFSNAYQNLSDYLENLPAAEVLPDNGSLSYTVKNRVVSAGQVVHLTTQSGGQITYKLRADAPWLQLSTITGTLSAKSPAAVTITVDPTKFDHADKYQTTVTILSGSAPPQFINVTATVTIVQSAVSAAITPNPVVQSNGQWSFNIGLVETAGAGTTLTAIKVNGTDYSSNIQGWFGGTHIAPLGALAAPLTAAGPFPGGTQYFEFWGVDDSGGKTWYRTATVVFQ
jgi:hypothetical protein